MNKKANYQRGQRSEKWAALWLMCKGYRLLARRYKTHHGEIDLVMRRSNVLAFIEVKARPTQRDGLEAVTPQAQQRIMRAAQHFVQRHSVYANLEWRFDVVVVRPRALPYHVCDAWRSLS